MTDKELYNLIAADDSEQQYDQARKELDSELVKPITEQDYDKIDRLIQKIEQITGEDRVTDEMAQRGIKKLHEKSIPKARRGIRRIRWIAACACAVLIVSNVWSYSAFGMNAFFAAYHLLNGGMTVDLSQLSNSKIESENRFTQQMRELCQEHGVDALIPEYIPNGFSPTDSYGNVISVDDYSGFLFYFSNNKQNLNLIIKDYHDNVVPPPVGLPTDSYHITQETINDVPVTIMKEDSQYSAAFAIGNTQYILAADGLDYDECYHVLISMFE